MIDQATITRYQPGGDIYATLEGQYGRNAALLISQAALTGDRDALNEAIARVRNGAKLDDSTASIFWHQVTTAPFDAPLDALNSFLGNATKSALKSIVLNPYVLLLFVGVAALVVFKFFPTLLKKRP
jgi:hypothetical protein